MSSPPAQQPQSDVDITTLAIAAVASGAAAYITSKVWSSGTLVAAAMTPVIIALVKEGLTKTSHVATRRVRDLTTGRTIEVEVPVDEPDEPFDPLAPVTPPPPTELQDQVSVHRSGGVKRRRWRLAIVTGLLAFVIAAVVVTVPQVIANSGSGGGGGGTTYFGGGSKSKEDTDRSKDGRDATPTPTPTADAEQTPTPEGEEETATPTPSATATPSVTATPTATPGTEATPSATPTTVP